MNEVIEVLDKFIYLSRLPNHFYGQPYVVKLINEPEQDYSISLTSIYYSADIPNDTLYYFVLKDNLFILLLDSNVYLNLNEYDRITLCFDNTRVIRENEGLFNGRKEGAVVSFPTIMVFKVGKKNKVFNFRKVQFETIHPIENITKKYWPITKRISAITNEPSFRFTDKSIKGEKAYEEYLKNGKGKFKIKAH